MDRMLDIPSDRRPMQPALLCALMAVTVLLVWSSAAERAFQLLSISLQ